MNKKKGFLIIALSLGLSACVKAPPSNVNNACMIFKEYPAWYKKSKSVEKRWHVPVPVQLAIVHQESRFRGDAKPERTKLLWIIPWKRPSSAVGYSQALDQTWERYQKKQGGFWASRKSFGDAVDFIGWYSHEARQRAGISPSDAYKLYLAYHEGVGGFMRKTYLKKEWLIHVARKVKAQSLKYQQQLEHCKGLGGLSWFG